MRKIDALALVGPGDDSNAVCLWVVGAGAHVACYVQYSTSVTYELNGSDSERGPCSDL